MLSRPEESPESSASSRGWSTRLEDGLPPRDAAERSPPWWAAASDLPPAVMRKLHDDIVVAANANGQDSAACIEHTRSFFALLRSCLASTIYPECSLEFERTPRLSTSWWPIIREKGPGSAVLAQTIGSGPMGVMTTWQIRRYGSGSDVNVLILGGAPLYTLQRLADALLADESIGCAFIKLSSRGPCLHVRMFVGLHLTITVARDRETFRESEFTIEELWPNAPIVCLQLRRYL